MRSRFLKVWDELRNNLPMDKMTTGSACVIPGTGLIFLGLKNQAVALAAKHSSLYEEGFYQVNAGGSMIAAPIINALYHGFQGERT